MNSEIKRIIAKLRSLEREQSPSMTFDRCDAKILLEYVDWLEEQYRSEWGDPIKGPLSWVEPSAGK